MYGADYCIRAFVFLNLHATCPSKTCYRSSLALINNCKAGKRKSPSVRAEGRRASLQASGALETKELLLFSCSMENQVSTFPRAVLSHRGASSSSTPAALSAVPALTPPGGVCLPSEGSAEMCLTRFFVACHSFQPALPTCYSLEIGVAGRRRCPCHGATGEETLLVLGQCVQILTAFSFGPD